MRKSWILLLAAVVCTSALIAMLSLGPATAEDDAKKAGSAPAPLASEGDKKAAEKKEEAKPDPYAVPDGDAAALVKFITDMQSMRPAASSQLEYTKHLKKSTGAQIAAAEKILAGKPTVEQAVVAVGAKIQSLMLQGQLGDKAATEKWRKFADQMRRDKRPKVADVAEQFALIGRFMQWRQFSSNDKSTFVADLISYISDKDLDNDHLQLAMFVVQQLEAISDNSYVVTIYEALIPALKKNPSPEFAALATRFEGVVRKMTLVGNTMDIEGTLLDGSNFDWSAYRGKVVLVDFWATWCGPCVAELPNVIKNYKLYHDKGFDVVGISLDQQKTLVEKFVAERQLPWTILYSDDAAANGWNHPMAVYYGITGIPAAVLVDQQGKVVTLNARGPTLRENLEKLLGKVDEPKEDKEGATDNRNAGKELKAS